MRFEFSPSAAGAATVPVFPEEFAQGILSLPELTIFPELTADAVIEAFNAGTLGGKLNFVGDGVTFAPVSRLYSGGVSMFVTLLFREDRLRQVTLSPKRQSSFDWPDEQELEQCLAFCAPLFEGIGKRFFWGSVGIDEEQCCILIRYL